MCPVQWSAPVDHGPLLCQALTFAFPRLVFIACYQSTSGVVQYLPRGDLHLEAPSGPTCVTANPEAPALCLQLRRAGVSDHRTKPFWHRIESRGEKRFCFIELIGEFRIFVPISSSQNEGHLIRWTLRGFCRPAVFKQKHLRVRGDCSKRTVRWV